MTDIKELALKVAKDIGYWDEQEEYILDFATRLIAAYTEGQEPVACPPRHYTCFHCEETFTSVEAAREHFGVNNGSVVACRLIQAQVDILRKAIDRTKQMAYSKFFAEELRLMITELESIK